MDISAKNILCKPENIKALAGAVHYEKKKLPISKIPDFTLAC